MKKIITILTFALILIGAYHYENYYTRNNCKVIDTYENCGVIIEDECGYDWVVYDDSLEIGETVKLKMHTNFTIDNIDDDTILKVVRIKTNK